jgi:site-specific DNA recombinase
MLHNPCYKGEGIVRSKAGTIVRPMPPLVSPVLWEQAQAMITRNRNFARKNAKRDYWLRGLVRCGNCGAPYTGTTVNGVRKYRCSARRGTTHPTPCRARSLHAAWIKAAVWAECVRFIEHPGKALDEARRTLRAATGKAANADERRRRLLREIAAKDGERERILTLYRRGVIDDSEAETQLDAIAREAGQLRESLEALRAQVALLDAQEAWLTDSTALLSTLRGELAQIERDDDWQRRREIMERYVRRIEVTTVDTGHWLRDAAVTIHVRLRPEPVAICAIDSSMSERRGGRTATGGTPFTSPACAQPTNSPSTPGTSAPSRSTPRSTACPRRRRSRRGGTRHRPASSSPSRPAATSRT